MDKVKQVRNVTNLTACWCSWLGSGSTPSLREVSHRTGSGLCLCKAVFCKPIILICCTHHILRCMTGFQCYFQFHRNWQQDKSGFVYVCRCHKRKSTETKLTRQSSLKAKLHVSQVFYSHQRKCCKDYVCNNAEFNNENFDNNAQL